VDTAKLGIDRAALLQSKFILLIADPRDVDGIEDKPRAAARLLEGLNLLTSYAKGCGITVTMENFSIPQAPFSLTADLLALFRSAPDVRFTLDAGNFTCVGEDVLEGYEKLKEFFAYLHLKDWKFTDDPRGFGGYCGTRRVDGEVYGEGVVPLGALLARILADRSYDGPFILEHNTLCFSPGDLERSARYLRGILQGRLEI
jgi:sugar phosphate isomerase/epimerase